jgi:alpha-L-fucosidase
MNIAVSNEKLDFVGAEVGDIRFTQTNDAFYLLSLSEPAETFVVDASLPILAGDKVTMIGAGNGTELAWTATGDSLTITVPSDLIAAGKYCWVFKITYS